MCSSDLVETFGTGACEALACRGFDFVLLWQTNEASGFYVTVCGEAEQFGRSHACSAGFGSHAKRSGCQNHGDGEDEDREETVLG